MFKQNELKAVDVKYVEQHVVVHDDIITGDGPQGAKNLEKPLLKHYVSSTF